MISLNEPRLGLLSAGSSVFLVGFTVAKGVASGNDFREDFSRSQRVLNGVAGLFGTPKKRYSVWNVENDVVILLV